MRASANPEDVLSELSGRIAMNSSEGLETCRWLLRDSERVVNGLHRVYNLIQSAMTLRGVSTTITAQSRLKAIYNIRSLFQRDLPKCVSIRPLAARVPSADIFIPGTNGHRKAHGR